MMNKQPNIAVLGAGISGLSVAWMLQKQGLDVIIYEKENHAGGVMQTHHQNNWLVEEGPNTMLVRNEKIWNLIDDLNLGDDLVMPGPQAQKRYIVRDEKLVAAPMSVTDFLKTDLLSVSAKLRLLKEPFISAPQKRDESVAQFIRQRLGPEPLEYAVNPFVSGIYAGDPEQLSVKNTFGSLFEMEQRHGSIAKGFFKRKKESTSTKRALISFDGGLQILPQTMAQKFKNSLHLNTPVQQISKDESGWKIQVHSKGEKYTRRCDAVISTLPSHQLVDIMGDVGCKEMVHKLSDISYAPMRVVGLGFHRDQINHSLDGFGMLIPEKEPFSLLGCLFSSSLFPNRAPEDHSLLTCFIGGARDPEGVAKPIKSLLAEIRPQLKRLLGAEGKPVFCHHTYWPRAIPQYTVGYDEYLRMMKQIESENAGLFLCGNYRGGVSVPDCILNGFKAAEKVTS